MFEVKERELALREREIAAREKLIAAQTVQTGVQASYSAMQAGAQIAQMPQIAPIADVVMAGAGYERPNPMGDDPNFPQPAAPAIAAQAQAAPEAQQNTSPTFPPVPDNGTSPMQGIETPETADNLPQGVEQ